MGNMHTKFLPKVPFDPEWDFSGNEVQGLNQAARPVKLNKHGISNLSISNVPDDHPDFTIIPITKPEATRIETGEDIPLKLACNNIKCKFRTIATKVGPCPKCLSKGRQGMIIPSMKFEFVETVLLGKCSKCKKVFSLGQLYAHRKKSGACYM